MNRASFTIDCCLVTRRRRASVLVIQLAIEIREVLSALCGCSYPQPQSVGQYGATFECDVQENAEVDEAVHCSN